MIFWILIAIVILVTILPWSAGYVEDGLIGGGIAIVLGAIVLLVALLVGGAVNAQPTRTETYSEGTVNLRSVGTGDSISGRSFLFSGYVEGKRVLNYAISDGEVTTLGSADASDSRIIEDGKTELRWHHTNNYYWWFVPWHVGSQQNYEFHIPQDSVVENYDIKN